MKNLSQILGSVLTYAATMIVVLVGLFLLATMNGCAIDDSGLKNDGSVDAGADGIAVKAAAVTLPNPHCLHDVCTVGLALKPSCAPEVAAVCGADPFCCGFTANGGSWDSACVTKIISVAARNTCGGYPNLRHAQCRSVYKIGPAQDQYCGTFMAVFCAPPQPGDPAGSHDPYCCNLQSGVTGSWDIQCVVEFRQYAFGAQWAYWTPDLPPPFPGFHPACGDANCGGLPGQIESHSTCEFDCP